jgi:ectoine hydroxylase-related dioxygenase (phytanoyl-CoA dioxygenase family)
MVAKIWCHHTLSSTSATGYLIACNVRSDAECEALIVELSSTIRGRAGTRHLMKNPTVATLATDRRLLEIARNELGSQSVPFRATLFEKSGHANWLVAWHRDTALPLASSFDVPGWGPWSEKAGIVYAHAPASVLSRVIALRVHLDASTSENGPLRVIPGSHTAGLLADDQVFKYVRAHSPVECLGPRGSVLAMRPLLIHSSSKARSGHPRRVLHIEYAESLDLAAGIRLAVA